MKRLKRGAALLLGAAMLWSFAACGEKNTSSTSEDSPQKGRYIETEITPSGTDGQHLQTFVKPDGSLVCLSNDLAQRWDSSDGGETWKNSPGPGAGHSNLENAWLSALLPNGDIIVAVNDDSSSTLIRLSEDGTQQPFSVAQLDDAMAAGQMPFVNQLKSLGNDRLLMAFYASGGMAAPAPPADEAAQSGETAAAQPSDSGSDVEGGSAASGGGLDSSSAMEEGSASSDFLSQGFYSLLLDAKTGEVVKDLSDQYLTALAPVGDKLYAINSTNEITTYSLADGSPLSGDTRQLPLGDFSFNLAMGAGLKDELYLADGKRIYKSLPDGTSDILLDGTNYSFAGQGMINNIAQLPGGDLVLDVSNQTGSRLYKYTWDANAQLDATKILKVWTLNENEQVRSAISALRKSNPDATVELEVAMGEGSTVTAQDAIKNLNTHLLGGDGPDVIVLGGTPVESYVQKGMLMDLSQMVDTSGVFPNLISPYMQDGKLYTLPTSFTIPLLLGSDANLKSADSMQALTQMVQQGNGSYKMSDNPDDAFQQLDEKDRPVLAPVNLREMFNYLWSASAPAVVDDKGFHADAATQLLESLKAISDKYQLSEDEAAGSIVAMMGDGGSAISVEGSALAYAAQQAHLGAHIANDMQILYYVMEPPGTQFTSFPGLSQGSWSPNTLLGINTDTDKAELSAALLQAFLSDDVQKLHTGGFPVTQSGMEAQIQKLKSQVLEYDKKEISFDYKPLLELARQPVMVDDALTQSVWEAAEKVCRNTIGLEEGVKQLEQELKNYLAERQ